MIDDLPLRRRLWVFAAVSVAIVVSAIAISTLMAPAAEAPTVFPEAVDGRDVLTVREAIDIQAADDGGTIAVGGWYQAGLLPSCPAPPGPPDEPALLEGYCFADFVWLMAAPEILISTGPNSTSGGAPEGPAIHPMFIEVAAPPTRPIPEQGDSIPTAVVLFGHFDDPRAADCRAEVRQTCLDRFVVEKVAWIEPELVRYD